MDPDEDFIYLIAPGCVGRSCLELTPERVRQEIERCKELCSALEQEHVDLQMAKEGVERRTQELRKEGELCKNFEQQMSLNRDEEGSLQASICLAKEEQNRLMQEKQVLQKKLEEVRKRVLWEDLVLIGRREYKLKISPCMSGDITNLQHRAVAAQPGSAQLQPSRCPRTVLLSSIPDVLGEELMRDSLEIHFQKASRGGGEVDALAYVPAGQQAVAVFTEDAG
ncbi:interferon-induced 35 kDa protein [Falco rusticolus]|uniref:interferon-induced 35 kDa protein n=1 Tax=Falco rusticolus TaxID=120794 RepID=UPI0018866C0B|nr:interferon-induced 35 kDa protein [Falco rusticolus]